jgi:hypothetical protein
MSLRRTMEESAHTQPLPKWVGSPRVVASIYDCETPVLKQGIQRVYRHNGIISQPLIVAAVPLQDSTCHVLQYLLRQTGISIGTRN